MCVCVLHFSDLLRVQRALTHAEVSGLWVRAQVNPKGCSLKWQVCMWLHDINKVVAQMQLVNIETLEK